MKKLRIISLILAFTVCLAFAFIGCGVKGGDSGLPENGSSTEDKSDEDAVIGGNVLIAFFSRADENYGVGVIEKGNTQILAEMIQEEVGGVLFHIQRVTPYPAVYSECTSEAQREKNANARPELLQTTDISEYDTIFLGYPIWWGDVPMPVYTFIESQDWNGKTVIPFCTNEGSGISGTVNSIKAKCSGATVSDSLSMRGTTAQNNREQAKNQVTSWLNGLGY